MQPIIYRYHGGKDRMGRSVREVVIIVDLAMAAAARRAASDVACMHASGRY